MNDFADIARGMIGRVGKLVQRAGERVENVARPSVRVITPPSIQPANTWTVSSVRNALYQHETGVFTESAGLMRAFGRDDRIDPCFKDRTNALVGADAASFSLQPAENEFKARSEAVLPAIMRWWDDVVTPSWQEQDLRCGIGLGVSVSYIPWSRGAREWRPQEPIHFEGENVYWDDNRKRYAVSTANAGQITVEPEDPNWFIYEPGGQNSFLCGAVRGLGLPFVARTWTYRDWARYNERHGLPIILLKEPSGEGQSGEKSGFFAGVKRMGQSGILRIPQGSSPETSYGAEFIEAKARSYDSFDKFLDRLNVAIAIYLKGQNLTTEVQAGAYASTGWHMRVRKDYAAGDAMARSQALRKQIIIRWGRYNVAGWDDRMAPWPTWNLTIPDDQKSLATTWRDGTDASEKLQAQKVPVDWSEYWAKLGVPLVKGAKFPLLSSGEPNSNDEPNA